MIIKYTVNLAGYIYFFYFFILLSNRETLKQTISVLEEKLNVINKESTLKGIYLTPEESKNEIMVAAKAEYENELEIKKNDINEQ